MKYSTIYRLFVIVFSLFISLETTAQNQNQMQRRSDPSQFQPIGKIFGKVIDSQTNQPIEYGNVVLFRMRDTVIANGTVSNSKGEFVLEKLLPGRYFLKISYMGYATKRFDSLAVLPNRAEIDLGVVKLNTKSINLSDVVVKAEREALNYNLDKKVYNVDNNMANSGGTAVDIMQHIPSVTVDADGAVAVRGNSNINVLVDGKPAALAGFTGSDVLAQIPASSIESIELVTNPSARYDPEGTAGIINVILKKKSNLGVNGTVMANAGTRGRYNTSLNMNLRGEDFNLFSSYDARIFNMNSGSTTLQTSTFGNKSSILDQYSDIKNKMINHSINIGGDYYLAEKEFVTLSAQFRFGNFNSLSNISNLNYDGSRLLETQFNRVSDGERNNNSGSYTLSYKKSFETKTQELTADVMYTTSSMNNEADITQTYFVPVFIPESIQKSLSQNSNKTWLIQSNYIQPLGNLGRLEGGFRSQIKDLTMSNSYLNYNRITQGWVASGLSNNDYNYKEQVHALYGIYSNNFGSFTFQSGIRAEQVFVKGTILSTNQTYESNYFDLYPTVHLRYSFSDLDEIQLSYSRRIDRPQNRQLNPYEDRSDSLNIFKGNPNLKPQYHNSVELGYTKTIGKTYLVSNLFYRKNTNLISTISTLRPNGVTYSTFENVSKGESYGLEFIATQPINDWWRMNGNVSFFNNKIDDLGTLGGTRESKSWLARMSSTMTISDGFVLQFMFFYSSPTILLSMGSFGGYTGGGRGDGGGMGGGGIFYSGATAQSKMKEQYSMDVMMRKEFMDGRLTITLRLSDVFNTRNFNTETTGLNFYTNNRRKIDSRMAFLGISYRLFDTKSRMQDQERQRRLEEGYDEL